MILNSPYISGSLTVTGNIITSGSITLSGSVASASYALNSTNASSASYVDYSNVANKPSLVSSSQQILDYNIFATTGSNIFVGTQTFTGSIQTTGSVNVNGSIVATGQIVAQTLNVQQVTSSIVYSSGSNVFGNNINNTQQFTGSILVSGSINTTPGIQITGDGVVNMLQAIRAGNTRFVVRNGVNAVGINTDTPNNPLTVNGNADFTGIIGVNGATEAGWALKSNGNLKVESSNGTTVLQVNDTSTGGKTWSIISSGAGNAHSVPAGTFYLRNSSDSVTAFQVTPSGNIGINSLGTNAKLEVVATSGEIFRADASGGALRIVADQTGVTTQGTLTHLGTISVKNASVPALQLYRDLDVTVVGPAGQGVEFGARSGASTYVAGAAIYGGLDNPATTGTLTFQTRTANSLTTKLSILSTGEAIFTGRVSTGGGGGGTANLNAQQASGDDSALFAGGVATVGSSKGIKILAGTNSSDYSLNVRDYAGNIALYVRGDRNVGIGTTSPSATLHIVGNEYIAKSGGGGIYKQTVVGQTTAAASGTSKKIAYVGFTHSVRVYVWANQSTAHGSSAIADIVTLYGSSNGGIIYKANLGNISDISITYDNSGSPAYTINVTLTYSGTAPTINYVIEGINHDNNIYTIA